jgi:small subunit ribosomal protein S15e
MKETILTKLPPHRTPKRRQSSRRREPSENFHTVALTLTSTFLQLHPLQFETQKRLLQLQPPPNPQVTPSPNQLTSINRLLDLTSEQLRDIVHARARRRFNRGLKRKPMGLIKKLRKAKQAAKPNEKPDLVKTHLRDMIVVPEMIGSVIGIYSGKEFNQVEIKPEMVGFYLGEFSISYKPVKHGRPGIGATHSSRFIPLK